MRRAGKIIANNWNSVAWRQPCKAKFVFMKMGEQSRIMIQICLHNWQQQLGKRFQLILLILEDQVEDLRGDLASEVDIAHEDIEYVNGFLDAYSSRKRELVERTMNSVRTNVSEDDGILPFCGETSHPYGPGFRSQSPMYHNGNFGNSRDERSTPKPAFSCLEKLWMNLIDVGSIGREARERSPHMTPSRDKRDKLSDTHSHKESVESMDHKSPLLVKDDVDDKLEPADRNPFIENDFELEPVDRSPVT
ncbi:hypothetical protein CXB51_025849 [Gossypium anomalum]|uniref:Uncharacterized protein n=1 Tax=Gossypium anomalum TaxID=47600 RepID=A0A8J5Y289_9ROSI|nr:hypothetical protein CXB51_025849 [Gossypium anomalum]